MGKYNRILQYWNRAPRTPLDSQNEKMVSFVITRQTEKEFG